MSETSAHIVTSYEGELKRLRDLLTEMGGLVESQVASAAAAVADQDNDAAMRVVEQYFGVDALELDIEQFVIRLLALRQPMAQDLRQVISALKITAALERIGDYAANVAKRSVVLNQYTLPFSLGGLSHMARLVQENLRLTIDAIGDADAGKAMQVWRADEAVDDIYNAIFREFITYMMEDPRSITPCTHLLFIAKNLERIGDHATNIAETVHYMVTGAQPAEARPKGDKSAYAVVRPQEQ